MVVHLLRSKCIVDRLTTHFPSCISLDWTNISETTRQIYDPLLFLTAFFCFFGSHFILCHSFRSGDRARENEKQISQAMKNWCSSENKTKNLLSKCLRSLDCAREPISPFRICCFFFLHFKQNLFIFGVCLNMWCQMTTSRKKTCLCSACSVFLFQRLLIISYKVSFLSAVLPYSEFRARSW